MNIFIFQEEPKLDLYEYNVETNFDLLSCRSKNIKFENLKTDLFNYKPPNVEQCKIYKSKKNKNAFTFNNLENQNENLKINNNVKNDVGTVNIENVEYKKVSNLDDNKFTLGDISFSYDEATEIASYDVLNHALRPLDDVEINVDNNSVDIILQTYES